jgi:hypothetical protein
MFITEANIIKNKKLFMQLQILDTQHTNGTMENAMDILHIERRGPLMNTLERFHIYSFSKENLQMNDTYADTHNPIHTQWQQTRDPCGGGLEYLHRSPASRMRRQKGNPVPGGITGPPCSWEIYS